MADEQLMFGGWDVEILPEEYQRLLSIIEEQQQVIDMLREQLDEYEKEVVQ